VAGHVALDGDDRRRDAARAARGTAAEFSFLLGLPTLGGACAHDLRRAISATAAHLLRSLGIAPVVLGVVVATVSAAIAVRWLVATMNRRGLEPFGWYRLVVSALFAALLLAGIIR
jgi:undecaprenyl-diphosphatase